MQPFRKRFDFCYVMKRSLMQTSLWLCVCDVPCNYDPVYLTTLHGKE